MTKRSKFKLNELKENSHFSIIIFLLLLLDLITKFLFTNKTYFQGSFISIQYAQNLGSAFSMFSNVSFYNTFIIVLSIIIIAILILNIRHFLESTYLKISFILMLSGILGNLFDRLIFGYVRDFIAVKYFSIFNIADSYLTLALIFYFFHEINIYLKEKK